MAQGSAKTWWGRFEAVCLDPLFATMGTLLIIVAGGMGSIWSEDIRKAFPFALPPTWKSSLAAWTFWGFAIAASLFFFFRQRAVDRAQARGQDAIVQRARELARLIRTLPPTNFLSVFSRLYNVASKATETVLGKPESNCEKSILEQAVRQILQVLEAVS